MITRDSLLIALAKPCPRDEHDVHSETFDPWEDVVTNIHGSYAKMSDNMMIEALEALANKTTGDFMETHGFAAEFILYVLSGHGLVEYGTSPRYGWPDHSIADLWQQLIKKWKRYSAAVWDDPPLPEQEKDIDN